MANVASFRAVYARVRKKIGLPQQEIAAQAGLHPITLSRWNRSDSVPAARYLKPVVAFLQTLDSKAAEELAVAAGQSLLSLGLVATRPSKRVEADAILIAAADAGNVAPKKARAIITTTLAKMRALDVTAAELEALLAQGAPTSEKA